MKKVNFFNGQIVTAEELNHSENTKVSAISERYTDILTDGIFRQPTAGRANEFEILPNGTSFDVGAGIAKITLSPGSSLPGQQGYSERIVIPYGDTTTYNETLPNQVPPKSTGNINIPLADDTVNAVNYVWIKYIQTATDDVSLHWETGEQYYPRQEDGYEIIVNTDEDYDDTNDAILLGTITSPGSDYTIATANISYTGRVGNYVTLKSTFEGEIEPDLIQYQQDTHSNGIICDETNTTKIREEIHISHQGAFVDQATLVGNGMIAQSFLPTSDIELSSVLLQIKVDASEDFTTEEIKAYIYPDNATDGIPDDEAIATGNLNTERITDSFGWIHFDITNIPLDSGTKYWIVLENQTSRSFKVAITTDGGYQSTTCYAATKAPAGGWSTDPNNDLYFQVLEKVSHTTISTAFLTVDYSESSPFLWIDQLIEDESIYVNGTRVSALSGVSEVDNKVRVVIVGTDSFNNRTSGVYHVIVNSDGEVQVLKFNEYNTYDITEDAVFKLWEINFDTVSASFKGFTDTRKYRLIAEDDIRGMEIDDDGNVTITETLTMNSYIDMDENDIINVGNESIKFTDGSEIHSSLFDTSGNLAVDVVDSLQIKDDAIVESKILNDAVTENKILNEAVTESKILDGAIKTSKIDIDADLDFKGSSLVDSLGNLKIDTDVELSASSLIVNRIYSSNSYGVAGGAGQSGIALGYQSSLGSSILGLAVGRTVRSDSHSYRQTRVLFGENIHISSNVNIGPGDFGFIVGKDKTINSNIPYSINFFDDVYIEDDLVVDGKITAAGGIDPPYVLYDAQVREDLRSRVFKEVPEEKQDGASVFWNKESKKLEIFVASEDKFYDILGNEI